jgi:hypothetical protein
MSISMERFGADGHFASYNPFPPTSMKTTIFQVQCRSCGYEPDTAITPPRLCPKCHSQSWERFARPGSILDNAERFQV